MKTQILTIFSALVLVTGIANSTHAATPKSQNAIVLNEVRAINKIEIRGNVELYISDSVTDEVKVYNKYYSESALVQNKNGVLRITSYNAEKLVVWVSANDLRSVSAYDNAEVKSFGKLSKIEFDVDLHNSSSAKLNLDAYAANVTLTDHAKADLTGTVDEFKLSRDIATSVNNYNFTAVHITDNKIGAPLVIGDDLADL
jgi:putative autotransporter adhesin-like protein